MTSKRYAIEVRDAITGEVIDNIKRVVWAESIGNFNPLFCRFLCERRLVQSESGDISDPFRRDEGYLNKLYIEVKR